MEKIFLTTLLIFLFSSLPFSVEAICEGPIVTCGYDIDGSGEVEMEEGCNLCHFFGILSNILEIILTCLLPIIGGAMFVLGGMYIVLSGISPSQLNQGKTILKATLVGIIIILAAWVGLNTIFTKIGVAQWTGLGTWWEFDCVAGFIPPPPPPLVVCGVCHKDDGTGNCIPKTTKWGENLHDCEGNNLTQWGMPENSNRRCVEGVCRTCTGLIYNDGCSGCAEQGDAPDYLACWYEYPKSGPLAKNNCSRKCQGHGAACVDADWNDIKTQDNTTYCPVCRSPVLSSYRYLYNCSTDPSGLIDQNIFPAWAGHTCYVRPIGTSQNCGDYSISSYGRLCVCEW